MTALSDGTISELIQQGKLVPKGDPECAVHCCYEFTADMLFRGSLTQGEPIGQTGAVIGPAELVWVRAKEQIAVPPDAVGIWIQTQSLSRQGLLLLNTTLVEPGYAGPLTAVFVNFGIRNVVLSETAKIAKVMFLRLDCDAKRLVGRVTQPEYDASILQIASNSPKTFLQVEQMLPNLERETGKRIEQMEQRSQELLATQKNELREDVNRHGLRWMGGLALGFVAASLSVWFAVGVVFPMLVEHYGNLDAAVQKNVSVGNAPVLEQLRSELRTTKSDMDQLRRDLADFTRVRDAAKSIDPGKTPGATK